LGVSPQEFLLLLISVSISAAGQFFLKLGALKLGKVTGENMVKHILSIITIPELLMGLVCYGLGAIAYILLLTRVKLSVVGPSASLIYVFSVLLGYFVFKESIPPQRIFGLGFIACGVVLVVWQPR
jgi:drug/metabolite transporter (DMT)-like permease